MAMVSHVQQNHVGCFGEAAESQTASFMPVLMEQCVTASASRRKGNTMLGTVLIILLVLLLLGALPIFPYNRKWGAAPGGVIGLLLVIVVVLLILGRI